MFNKMFFLNNFKLSVKSKTKTSPRALCEGGRVLPCHVVAQLVRGLAAGSCGRCQRWPVDAVLAGGCVSPSER